MRQPTQGPARVLLASPTQATIETVGELLRAYAPDRLVASHGVPASVVAACGRMLGVASRQLDGDLDAASTLAAVAEEAGGITITLLVSPEVLPRVLAYALGVSDEGAARFTFVSSAISVLECDADGRWAVLRVNEGAWPANP